MYNMMIIEQKSYGRILAFHGENKKRTFKAPIITFHTNNDKTIELEFTFSYYALK